ncbi:MAG: NYN domain-containing protein [Candidatus Colwellbacteria bacterium]|nr:NYN domain-containing protein [Candidatus Colwellbacteria bacterium]
MALTVNPEHRIGVFVDIQNLYHSAKHLYGGRVNYKEILKTAVAGRRLVRTLAYVVTSDPQTGEDAFFEALEKEGMELRVKELQTFSSGAKKADWDVGMAVDAIRLAPGLDVIILFTGDGDFIPLVEYLKSGMGKIVEVVAFGRTSSGKLREKVDRFIDIEAIPKAIFKTEKSRKRATIKPKNKIQK